MLALVLGSSEYKPNLLSRTPSAEPTASGCDKFYGDAGGLSAPPAARRQNCSYGTACYRNKAEHRRQFAHPGDDDWANPAPARTFQTPATIRISAVVPAVDYTAYVMHCLSPDGAVL